MSADESTGHGERSERPPLRVIRGDATPEEVAAIVAVLAAAGGGGGAEGDADAGRRRSRWAAPEARIRPSVAHGPGAWRGSALPH